MKAKSWGSSNMPIRTEQAVAAAASPPTIVPARAKARPLSGLERICRRAICPLIRATMHRTALAGKQTYPVNGTGATAVQKERTLKIVAIKLNIAARFMGRGGAGGDSTGVG